jgi:hypothetical protein
MPRVFLVVFLATAIAGCGDDLTSRPPTTPTTPSVTETFTGTLTRNGGATHPFVGSSSGTVTATLTTVAPDASVIVGLSVGTWNGNACQVVIAKDNAVQGSVVVASASSAGNLCVRIYDTGHMVNPVSYLITVVHP